MFERFHQDAREALARAKEEAAKSGQREIHTKHLLLGLLAASGHASDALTAAGADPAELRAEVPLSHAVPPVAPDRITVDGSAVDATTTAGIAIDEAVAVLPPRDGGTPGSAAQGSTESDETTYDDAPPDDALAASGVTAGAAIEETAGLRMTKDARTALEHARRTAQRFKHQRVSTGHVLLGIIDEPGNSAVGALTVAGIHVGTLRADVLRRLEVEATVDPGRQEP